MTGSPEITKISPDSGPPAGGTKITITGSGFTGASAVHFGTTAAQNFTVDSDTSITATSPAGIGTVDIAVTIPGGTSTATAADKFTYTPPANDVGCVWVTSDPPGADIQVDCQPTDKKTPARIDNIKSGSRTVGVSLTLTDPPPGGYYQCTKTITVSANSMTAVSFTLLTPENREKVSWIVGWTSFVMGILIVIAVATKLVIPSTWVPDLVKIILYLACAGGIGGATFSFYELVYHLGDGDFSLQFFWWFMIRPLIGAVYGTFVFFLVAGGLMTLSGANAPSLSNLFTTQTAMFYLALAFLAGYAEEPVSLQLKAIAEALFKKPSDSDETVHNKQTASQKNNKD